mmetsp:Transcript_36850/g.96534  ORF Transcript_36850/g.96534 Transcript_36850/m.96534 type:complete len:208 (-) Transcript_36850:1158-1781(-)
MATLEAKGSRPYCRPLANHRPGTSQELRPGPLLRVAFLAAPPRCGRSHPQVARSLEPGLQQLGPLSRPFAPPTSTRCSPRSTPSWRLTVDRTRALQLLASTTCWVWMRARVGAKGPQSARGPLQCQVARLPSWTTPASCPTWRSRPCVWVRPTTPRCARSSSGGFTMKSTGPDLGRPFVQMARCAPRWTRPPFGDASPPWRPISACP